MSIIFSSGDGGVGDLNPNPATQQCFSNDGTNRTMFIPKFPPSCPLYVVTLPEQFVSLNPVCSTHATGQRHCGRRD